MVVNELSLEEIRDYLVQNGGKVSNRELVLHFKHYLKHPDPKATDDARIKFKNYVNKIASRKTEGDVKYLYLKPEYAADLQNAVVTSSPVHLPQNTLGIPASTSSQDLSATSPGKLRQPPPYRPPPPVSASMSSLDTISLSSSNVSLREPEEQAPPQAPPRRKSQSRTPSTETEELSQPDQEQSEFNSEQAISVKERTQKFNRLASVDNELSPQPPKDKTSRRAADAGADEDDGASVTSLGPKRAEWIVAAARGDYQMLAKLATANPRLVKTKTALHWAAKHGNLDIVKLIAGTYGADTNARTNGGYTPMHIAMQFGHEELYRLLKNAYGAQPDMRDWSGRTPMKYLQKNNNTAKGDGYHKLKVPKKTSDKDLGFLRIGSLNVRVKKTTEAFSNFLGVGNSGSLNAVDHVLEKVHKNWGSADNVSKESDMAAPKLIPHSKRKLKHSQEQTTSYSTPGTPNQKRSLPSQHHLDSDSDTACGFDQNWKN